MSIKRKTIKDWILLGRFWSCFFECRIRIVSFKGWMQIRLHLFSDRSSDSDPSNSCRIRNPGLAPSCPRVTYLMIGWHTVCSSRPNTFYTTEAALKILYCLLCPSVSHWQVQISKYIFRNWIQCTEDNSFSRNLRPTFWSHLWKFWGLLHNRYIYITPNSCFMLKLLHWICFLERCYAEPLCSRGIFSKLADFANLQTQNHNYHIKYDDGQCLH